MNKSILSCGWKLHGTNTFRLSSSKLLGWWGGNCQNPDHRLMRHVHPRSNHIFLQCDQAGAEAKIVAYLCKPGRLRDLFIYNIKPHTYLALHIFIDKWLSLNPHLTKEMVWMKSPQELVTKEWWPSLNKLIKSSSLEYALGKMVCHAKNYDMKYITFIINVLERTNGDIILSAKDAKLFLDMFDQLFPEVLMWQEEIRGIVKSTRILRNLFGHPKRFLQPLRNAYERQWLAFIPQSTVGELTVIASNEIHQYIIKNNLSREVLLVNNKHDSLLLDCHSRHRDLCINLLRSTMSKTFATPRGETFKMGVEVSEGMNWDKQSTDNPEGMHECID